MASLIKDPRGRRRIQLKAAVQANTSRFYFISREEARKVLEACPDAQMAAFVRPEPVWGPTVPQ